ncbi:MAG TPA: bifunctional DNA-formamidopyrimidine glycosylase/DNA-(apurinic or apyrimidinic site) lyase [Acidimicrobiales bacterium]|nr:bifunctional DNA-formamidopyrimidine glycosylase/DNA-(apurinic or apyrimidinic site) lyase [Acidimicrobiales bacterium]
MPELPEIETIRRGLEREAVGRRVKSVQVLEPRTVQRNGSRKAFQARVDNAKIKAVERRGSLLVLTLDSGELLVVDVGATGRLVRAAPRDEVTEDTQLVVSFTQGGQLRMADPEGAAEAFVVLPDLLLDEVPELASLGLDPVAAPVSWTAFARALVARSGDRLKPLLMDQTFVVGLGGLYADEILHDAGLRPDREVATVTTMEIRRLYRSLVEILHEATKHHGTSTAQHPFTDLHGKPGAFQQELEVWGRDGQPCRRCRNTVTKQRSGSRVTYWCPSCQV